MYTTDIELAVRENFVSVEYLKRCTTPGMASDQGKTSNLDALVLLGELTGRTPEETGTTRYRFPYVPVAIGALAGRRRGALYRPVRHLPLHDWHVAHGGVLREFGGWLRPACYPRDRESEHAAESREALAVRRQVGLFDGSPLGKIEVVGRGAAGAGPLPRRHDQRRGDTHRRDDGRVAAGRVAGARGAGRRRCALRERRTGVPAHELARGRARWRTGARLPRELHRRGDLRNQRAPGRRGGATSVPDDIGWGHVLRRKHDFIGRRSLLRPENQRADRYRFVGLEPVDGADLPTGAHLRAVMATTASEGYITSSAWSPTLGRWVALGMLRSGRARHGETVVVLTGKRTARA